MLTDKQIQQNYERFRGLVNELFPSRSAELNRMYDYYEDRILIAPASTVEHYHNAFPGGYIEHVLRVMDFSTSTLSHWKAMGLEVDNFTTEELLFAAMHHDLGKIGLPGNYNQHQPNPSDWHRKNQGKIYTHDSAHPFMLVPDLSIFILQHFGVKMSFQELLAIRTHDGTFDRANEAYYFSSNVDTRPRTNINMILHQADYCAARFEFERWVKSTKKNFFYTDDSPKFNNNTNTSKPKKELSLDEFDEIFGQTL